VALPGAANERWARSWEGCSADQGLLGVAVYGLLVVICALTFLPAAPLCFMAGFSGVRGASSHGAEKRPGQRNPRPRL
jgi:hypothetical protein